MSGILETIKTLTEINSPSGNADEAINYVKNYVEDLGYHTKVTNKGGLLITVDGTNENKQRCITAHVDTLGAMVKEIKENGRLALDLIGGFHFNAIEGEYCEIQTQNGQTFSGTICLHETSVHVYKDNHNIPRDKEHMEVRIDEITHNAQETKDLGIEVGDFISFDPRTVITQSGFIKSRHLDDKASVGMILELLKSSKRRYKITTYNTILYF